MTARRLMTIMAIALLAATSIAYAHEGPPFPILSNQITGAYVVSIWTDPDTTDDGSARGQFWIKVYAAHGGTLPRETRATVTITPLSRPMPAPTRSGAASAVRGDVTNQFAALVMDHEGRFAVHVTIEGPLGRASADAEVDATYDLRPPPSLILLYLVPFALIGLLWGRLLIRRYRSKQPTPGLNRRPNAL
jgi:hypothetical protein